MKLLCAKGARMYCVLSFRFRLNSSSPLSAHVSAEVDGQLQKETAESGSFASVLHLVPLVVG